MAGNDQARGLAVVLPCASGRRHCAGHSDLHKHDTVHRVLRLIGVTRETSYPSEWYSAFAEYANCYIVLHFHDGRRLYGWPEELPSHPSGGHFIMDEGEWLVDDERLPVESGSVMLISANDVRMVEFVEGELSDC
jgi:hypothetical protein